MPSRTLFAVFASSFLSNARMASRTVFGFETICLRLTTAVLLLLKSSLLSWQFVRRLPERMVSFLHCKKNSRACGPVARSGQRCAQALQTLIAIGPGRQRGVEIDLDEARLVIGLHLRNAIHVGADHRADHCVAAAGNGIPVQNDGLQTPGHLNRAVRITRIDAIGRIGTCAEGLGALFEFEWPPLLVAVA